MQKLKLIEKKNKCVDFYNLIRNIEYFEVLYEIIFYIDILKIFYHLII